MKHTIGIFAFLFVCGQSFGQTYLHPTSGIDGTYAGNCMTNTCSGTYYDNGGAGGNYSNNISSYYRVFCPNAAGMCMTATFTSFDVQNDCTKDYLTVGNGATQNSPTMAIPGVTTVVAGANRICGTPPVPFTVTSTNASGCLVMRFTSNASSVGAGWAATLSCTPCAVGPTGTDPNDCINAIEICNDLPVTGVESGPGLISESCSGCTAGGENYSTWYYFCFATSGTFAFTIDPVTNSDDYDFALYGPGVTCGALGSPVRCSYAASTGNTGLKYSVADISEDVTGNGWVDTLHVEAGECYYMMVNHWSPPVTGYTIDWNLTDGATFVDCGLLPVTITNFSGEAYDNNTIALQWETATELNNDYFLINRSSDGIHFEPFMQIDGQINTTVPTTYFAVDNQPFEGTNYYALSQVDLNGRTTHLKTISMDIRYNDALGTIQVYDLSGRVIVEEVLYRSQIAIMLETMYLKSGVYLYRYTQENGISESGKFSVVR